MNQVYNWRQIILTLLLVTLVISNFIRLRNFIHHDNSFESTKETLSFQQVPSVIEKITTINPNTVRSKRSLVDEYAETSEPTNIVDETSLIDHVENVSIQKLVDGKSPTDDVEMDHTSKVFEKFLSFYHESLEQGEQEERRKQASTTTASKTGINSNFTHHPVGVLRKKNYITTSSATHTITSDRIIAASCQFQQQEDSIIFNNNKQQQQKDKVVAGGRPICCTPWQVSMDDWWLHQPDWEVSYENDTMTCFSPIIDETHANYIRHVHSIQWGDKCNCSNIMYTPMASQGYSFSIGDLARSLTKSIEDFGSPFKVTKRYEGDYWSFAYNKKSRNEACSDRDMFCYFLNMTKCTSPYIESQTNIDKDRSLPFQNWIIHYISRQKQWIRQRVYQYIQMQFGHRYVSNDISNTKNNTNNTNTAAMNSLFDSHHSSSSTIVTPWEIRTPCTVFHVRRTDVVWEPGARRYFRLSEYINKSKTLEGDTILLLTDDQSTIDEANYLYPNYNWLYVNRTRYTGYTKFGEHYPSGDPTKEIITILAELQVASKCNTIVQSRSGYATFLSSYMTSSYRTLHDDPNFQSIRVDFGHFWDINEKNVSEKQVWATKFLTELYEEIEITKQQQQKQTQFSS